MSGSSVIGISVPLEKESNKNVNVWQTGKKCYEENKSQTSGDSIIFGIKITNS